MQIYTVLKIEVNGNLSFFVDIHFCDFGLPKAKTLFSEENFCQGNVSSLSFVF